MDSYSSGRNRYARATAEGQVRWARGALIVASMVGVILIFFIVLSLLQFGTKENPQIRGLAPVATSAPASSAQATATAAAAGAPPEITAVVHGGVPNVHTGPGVDYQIIGTLPNGSTVTVIGRTPDSAWLQVMLPNGQRGWSGAGFLTVSGGAGSVPITQ